MKQLHQLLWIFGVALALLLQGCSHLSTGEGAENGARVAAHPSLEVKTPTDDLVAIAMFDGWDVDLIIDLERLLDQGGVRVRNVRTGVWSAIYVSREDAEKGRELLRKSLALFSGKVRVQAADQTEEGHHKRVIP